MLELSKYFHSSGSPKTRAMDGPLLYVNCCSELTRRGKQAWWGWVEGWGGYYKQNLQRDWSCGYSCSKLDASWKRHTTAWLFQGEHGSDYTLPVAECLHLFEIWRLFGDGLDIFALQIIAEPWGALLLHHLHSTSSKHLTQSFVTVLYHVYLLVM